MTTASVLCLTDLFFWICVQIYCDAFNSARNDNKWIRISQRSFKDDQRRAASTTTTAKKKNEIKRFLFYCYHFVVQMASIHSYTNTRTLDSARAAKMQLNRDTNTFSQIHIRRETNTIYHRQKTVKKTIK